MSAQTIRTVLLNGHAWLREQADRVEQLSALGAEPELRKAIASLCDSLLGHMEVEELILRPALRRIDAWGDARIARLEADHEAQRIRVRLLRRAANDPSRPLAEIQESTAAFLADLREDMQAEEAELLNPELLRDDPVSIELRDDPVAMEQSDG